MILNFCLAENEIGTTGICQRPGDKTSGLNVCGVANATKYDLPYAEPATERMSESPGLQGNKAKSVSNLLSTALLANKETHSTMVRVPTLKSLPAAVPSATLLPEKRWTGVFESMA